MTKKTTTKGEVMKGYPLRLPSYIKEWLEKIAKPERRSVNDEIILILEREYNAINHKN